MHDAIILGGGISGLTAGYLLQRDGFDVAVIEKAERPGGPISSIRKDGYLHERGPNSLLLPDPWVEQWLRELGLENQLQETAPAASNRYIAKNGRLVPVPASPLNAITTPLFSLKGKLGFLAEPFRSRISDHAGSKETVASFVTRRMGKDFLDYAIDPFVSGVYAGDPNQLILAYAFPLMRSFEREGGSIIRGALRYKKKRKREGTAFKKRSISFRDGLGILPETIARKLGNRLWLRSTVETVERLGDLWRISWSQGGERFSAESKRLLVCLPSYAIKSLSWSSPLAEAIRAAPDLAYPPVHSLALGFKCSQISHPLDGFGVLVPSKEPLTILGALFSSSLFPGRAPEDHALLTVMIGGVRHPELADANQDALTAIAMQDLKPLLGITGEPEVVNCVTWAKAIPQYTAEFGAWRDALRRLESDHQGLHFGGNSVDGIAMGSSILSGKRLADELAGRQA